jgi:hypothetical protein
MRTVPHTAVAAQNTDNTNPLMGSAFNLQDVFPDEFARSLTYDVGQMFGRMAGAANQASLQGFLTDAVVLSRRHGSVGTAAELMGVSEDGLRGFLDGAAGHPLFRVELDPRP